MAGFGDISNSNNRAFSLDLYKESNDVYDARYQQIYGYKSPYHEEFRGPPLILDDSTDEDAHAIITTGVMAASLLTENILSHPFVVLRRQCQVHNSMSNYHILPYTLVTPIVKIHRRQCMTTLWKGIGSTCIVKGLNLAVEDLVLKATSWPKDISKCNSVLKFIQHIFLKSISIAFVTPFYAASLVETVQSDIASDKPGIFDVFRDGGMRLLEWGSPSRGRMLPIWAILIPTVSYGLVKYCFNASLRFIIFKVLKYQHRNRIEVADTDYENGSKNSISDSMRLKANMIAFMLSEAVCYPIETIIHRLQIQGTRTIIDNLDSGTSVLPILTGYDGFFDCYRSTLAKEGVGGLYKGFGALILQLTAHIAIIKLTTCVVTELANLLKPAKSPTSSDESIKSISQQKYLFN